MPPLVLYHLCPANTGRDPGVALVSLSLVFGERSVLPPISRFDSPVRSLRYRRFCTRYHTNATHQIAAPWGRGAKHSWNGQQGRGDILCSHSLVSFLGCGYAICGEGEVLRTSTRSECLLSAESAFPAVDCRYRNGVSRPKASERGI